MYFYAIFMWYYSILVHSLEDFKKDASHVPLHLLSRHSKEMALKSEVVCSSTVLDI